MNVSVCVTADVVATALAASSVFQVYINDNIATLQSGSVDIYEATFPITSGAFQIHVDVGKSGQSVRTASS